MSESTLLDTLILDRAPRIPDHVVYREFAQQTAILNLQTGLYHGMNPTGARIFALLGEKESVREVADALNAEFPESADKVTRDLCIFCLALSKRGLLELVER